MKRRGGEDSGRKRGESLYHRGPWGLYIFLGRSVELLEIEEGRCKDITTPKPSEEEVPMEVLCSEMTTLFILGEKKKEKRKFAELGLMFVSSAGLASTSSYMH